MGRHGHARHVGCCLAVGLGLVAGGTALAREVPKGTEVIQIDLVPGKFGAVRFKHAQHNDEYKRPDGSRVRCRDCHHRLSADEPASAEEDMKCSGCHARYGDPPKVIGGKVAPALARLRPDGAMEYRSILFHDWCWACHHKTIRDGHQNDRCKLCHERGVSSETMHGRYDASRQPGTDLSWMRCAVGARWNGKGCDGDPRLVGWDVAIVACPDGYRLPSRAEALGLLGSCGEGAGAAGAACGCRASAACSALFGADEGAYWTSELKGDAAWVVRFGDSSDALAATSTPTRVRCVRPEPP